MSEHRGRHRQEAQPANAGEWDLAKIKSEVSERDAPFDRDSEPDASFVELVRALIGEYRPVLEALGHADPT